MSTPRHIVLLEASVIIREGLTALLAGASVPFACSGADTLSDALGLHLRRPCHLILVNPGFLQNNLKEFRHIRQQMPHTPWVGIVYAHHDPALLQELVDTITISDPPSAILNLIERHLNHEPERNPIEEVLSERETEVLLGITEGLSNKEIADRLHISIHTVMSHRKNIAQKTGIRSVSGLTIYAVVKNLISLDRLS